MASRTYDLIVIGSGPAGEKGAAQAAYFGKAVALVEKEPPPVYGGAAANTGTLPSKTLRETALFLSGFRNRRARRAWSSAGRTQVDIDGLMRPPQGGRPHTSRSASSPTSNATTSTSSRGSPPSPGPTPSPSAARGRPRPCSGGEVILIATGSAPYRPPDLPGRRPPGRRLRHDPEDPGHPPRARSSSAAASSAANTPACSPSWASQGHARREARPGPGLHRRRGRRRPDGRDARARRHALPGRRRRPRSTTASPLTVRLESGLTVRPDLVLISSGRSGNTEAARAGPPRRSRSTTAAGSTSTRPSRRPSPTSTPPGDVDQGARPWPRRRWSRGGSP